MIFPDATATIHQLSCGLKVILDPHHHSPVVSSQIWIEAGSRFEGPYAGAGISHLLEHMVFKGTKSHDCAGLAQEVQDQGGHWNAYTSFDRTVYYIDGPSDSTSFFAKTLCELVFEPSLPEEDFETEKDVIRREIDMGLDDPDSVSSQLLFSSVFQYDHRCHPVIGYLSRFNSITHGDLLKYHQERYLPRNTFLIISGDIDKEKLLEELEEFTKEYPDVFPEIPASPNEPIPVGQRIERQEFSTHLSHLNLSWPGAHCTHPDAPALELLAQSLGGGQSCPLFQNFREKNGLTHHISTWAWTPKDSGGLFSISAEVDFEKRDEVEKRLQEEILSLVEQLTTKDLEKARRQIAAAQFRGQNSASGRASDLASNYHEARNLDFTRDYLTALSQVTLDDLKDTAIRYLRPDRLTITSLDPLQEKKKTSSSPTRSAEKDEDELVLSNGLRVLLQRDTRLPVVYLQAPFLAGLPCQTAEKAGIGQLHASCFRKGTKNRDALSFNYELEALGAKLGLSTGNNTSILGGFCLSEDLLPFLSLSAESLVAPIFPDDAVELEKAALIAAIEEASEDSARLAFYHLRRKIFGDQHYGIPKLGLAETVSKLTAGDIENFHQTHFQATNSVLALAGHLPSSEELREQLEGTLGQLATGIQQTGLTINPESIPLNPGLHETTLDREQAVLAIGFPGLSFDSEKAVAAEVLQEYCSNMAGPLFTRIREKLGLAYYVSTTQFQGIGTGLFSAYLGTSPEQLELAHQELKSALAKIAEIGLTEQELTRARTACLSAHALDEQSLSSQARQAALNSLLGLPRDHDRASLEQLRKITLPEVNDFAKHLFTRTTTTSIVSPSTYSNQSNV